MKDPTTLPTYFSPHPFIPEAPDEEESWCAQEHRRGRCIFPRGHEIHGGNLTSEAMMGNPRYTKFAEEYAEVLGTQSP